MTRLADSPIPVVCSPPAKPVIDSSNQPQRTHVALFEPDAALRHVLTVTLLRAGCIVRFRRSLSQVTETLVDGDVDAVIVALDDPSCAAPLAKCNRSGARLFVLTQSPSDPSLLRRLPDVRFLLKPFDTRQLLTAIGIAEAR